MPRILALTRSGCSRIGATCSLASILALSDQVKHFLAFLSHLSTFRPQLPAG
jgi:hypothetical protein